MKKTEIKVGSTVAFNLLPDAVWFDVLAIDGFRLTIREHGTDYAVQHMDISLVKKIRPDVAPTGSYGTIKFKTADREEIHQLSFANKSAWFDTERYINNRNDLIIVDSFWGYALFDTKTAAVEVIEAFAK